MSLIVGAIGDIALFLPEVCVVHQCVPLTPVKIHAIDECSSRMGGATTRGFMFDLYQSHWVMGVEQQLYIASAPSMQAPVRLDMQCEWHEASRRLEMYEADAIYQAALDGGMQPLTFLHSAAGIAFVQQMLAQPSWSAAS